MPKHCKICDNEFGFYPETIVLCGHKGGFVHIGCCMDNCSWNKQPCEHAMGTYDRI